MTVIGMLHKHVPGVCLSAVWNRSIATIPHSPYWPIVGTLPYLIRNGGASYLHKYIDQLHQTLGPIFYYGSPQNQCVFINDPELNINVYQAEGNYPKHIVPLSWLIYLERTKRKRGLFFMDGEVWKSNRKILSNIMLHPDSTKSNISAFNNMTNDLLKIWSQTGVVMDLERQLYCWNIESMGYFAFGKRIGCIDNILQPKEVDFAQSVHSIFLESTKLEVIPTTIASRYNLNVWKRFCKAITTSLDLGDKYVNDAFNEVKKNGFNNQGLVSDLMTTGDVSEETIRLLITDLILAAADTTSQAAQWMLYELGRHPNIAKKARLEVQSVTGGDNVITSQHLLKLTYIKSIIKEVLRLYPIAPFLTRQITRDVQWNDHIIPKDTWVVTSVMNMSKNENYYREPLKFIPERWLKNHGWSKSEMNVQSRSSVPWGLGIRNCLGKRIAQTQLAILTAQTLLNFEWEVDEDIPPIMRMIITPKQPIHLKLKEI